MRCEFNLIKLLVRMSCFIAENRTTDRRLGAILVPDRGQSV